MDATRKEYLKEFYKNYYQKHKDYYKKYRKEHREETNAYSRKYSKKRRIAMSTGKMPWDKNFQKQIDNWLERTYKELKYLEEHTHDGYIDLRRLYALSKLRV